MLCIYIAHTEHTQRALASSASGGTTLRQPPRRSRDLDQEQTAAPPARNEETFGSLPRGKGWGQPPRAASYSETPRLPPRRLHLAGGKPETSPA